MSCDVPNVMGNVRVRATKFKTLSSDVREPTCSWWIWFRARSNIGDIE